MARYMLSSLNADLTTINAEEAAKDRDTYLRANPRNGYIGLDEYERATNRCIRNIECGTPRECYTAALAWTWAR